MILSHVPYLQANFVLGLDTDEGPEPFELTKRFLDMSPGAFPAFSLLTSFGQAAPINLDYQREGRILPFPFHHLNNNHAMNVRVKNYAWPEFHARLVDLTVHACSVPMMWRRLKTNGPRIPGWLNVIRAMSSEGNGRIKYHRDIHRRLEEDHEFRAFFEQDSTKLPQFYTDRIREDLGPFWEWLPEGGLQHDAYAYLNSVTNGSSARSEVSVAGTGQSPVLQAQKPAIR
jgi:hypothetical protein